MAIEKLTEKQKELARDNYPLAKHFIKKMLRKGVVPEPLVDDFISDVYLRFCFAALKFERGHNCKFSTYAYKGCKFGLQGIRGWTKRKFERNRFVPSGYFEYLPEYDNRIEKAEKDRARDEDIFALLNVSGLTEREKVMIMDYYLEELNPQEMETKYCLTYQAIHVALRRSLQKLKRAMDRRHLTMEDFYKI